MRNALKKRIVYSGIVVVTLIILLHPDMNARRTYEYIEKRNILNSLIEETAENFSSTVLIDCDYDDIIYDETTLSITLIDGDLIESHKIKEGGEYAPSGCKPKYSTAIIVPYRDRAEQLRGFLVYMHTFFHLQHIHYRIFVVEQVDSRPFNRAKLLNIGAVAAMKAGYPCLVLHDVDLLPLRPANLYACTEHPRHMSSSINKFSYIDVLNLQVPGIIYVVTHFLQARCRPEIEYMSFDSDDDSGPFSSLAKRRRTNEDPPIEENIQPEPSSSILVIDRTFVLPYLKLFGGAIAIASKQYKEINGMSNDFYGGGGENDDLYSRLESHELKLCRFEPSTSRYHMFTHKQVDKALQGNKLLTFSKERMAIDGLNSLKYTEVATVLHPLFTHIMVDL